MGRFAHESGMIHYLEKGAGELVVLLPGNTASGAAFTPQLPVFGSQYRTVALDYVGTGRSDRRARWPDDWWGDAAWQVEALLDHLAVDRAMLVGTSGGAVVALRAAAAFPGRVGAVVADSFSARFDAAMLERNVLSQRDAPSEEQRSFWAFCHGDDWPDVVEADTKVVERLVARGGDWLAVHLGRVAAPVLLTGSTADPAIPDLRGDYERLRDRLPDARLFLADAGDHPFMWTRPELFHREALAFLARAASHE
jgi:pimeloyl-ACP methyl ester carboxylesterase